MAIGYQTLKVVNGCSRLQEELCGSLTPSNALILHLHSDSTLLDFQVTGNRCDCIVNSSVILTCVQVEFDTISVNDYRH